MCKQALFFGIILLKGNKGAAQMKKEIGFEGFNFITNPKNIIVVNSPKTIIYDDGSGLTGDFSEVDNYFNDEMISSDEEINAILSMDK